MKISIFSDCHCGFKYGEERGEDSFVALEEALEKSSDCDLILMAGDIFDTRIPKPEVYARTARILSKVQSKESCAKLVDLVNKDFKETLPSRGIPIVSIHGTHERRSKTMINPIHNLEHSGLLLHLDCSTAVFDIRGQKVAVHGMSGVSERYAKETLDAWNPQPIPNAINIFMFHQSVEPYIYSPLDPPTIKVEDLPKGFDLYVLGHIHWHEVRNLHGGKFLLTGSTTPTSLHKNEVTQPKVIFKYDGNNIQEFPLQKQRKIIFEEFNLEAGVKERITNLLTAIPSEKPKQIVTIKLKGQLPKGSVVPNFRDIEDMFRNKFILNINKNIESEDVLDQKDLFKSLRENRLSPEEQGLQILNENIKKIGCGINVDDIFDLLVDEEADLIFNILAGKQRTLA